MNGSDVAEPPGFRADPVLHSNPFVGPRPLEKGQPIFGRDGEIDQLYYRLSAERILLFHSPSGAGKSSLLQAGLLPRLAAQFDVWTPARVSLPPDPANPASSTAVNRYVRSCKLSFESEVPRNLQRPESIIASQSLADYVAGRPRRRSAPGNIVLIFDQFEEVLTVDPLAFDARRDFFLQLGVLLQNPAIWAIFALREDYIAQLDPFSESLPTHLKNRFRLDLLSRDAAQEAIAKSVETAGRSFAPEALTRLVSDLALTQVQQPSGEFRSEPGRTIEPLHLQVTCRGLWDRLPPDRALIQCEDVSAFGDVTAALAGYYATEVARAAAGDETTERDIRLWCGERLITHGNIRGQILREPDCSGGLDNDLIGALIDTHLVRAESRSSATWYELAHDRLIAPVRQDNTRWFAAHLNLAQSRALEWNRNGEPEGLLLTGSDLKEALDWAAAPGRRLTLAEDRLLAASRRKRNRRRIGRGAVAILAVLLVAVAIFAYYAHHEQSVARKAFATAQSNLALGENAVNSALSSAGVDQGQEFAASPAVMALRGQIIKRAADFYKQISKKDYEDPKFQAYAAWGHAYLADNYRLLGQPSEAIPEYRAAIKQFLAIDGSLTSPQVQQDLAYCYAFMGESYRREFGPSIAPNNPLAAQAIHQYDEALAIRQRLHQAEPANASYTQSLAETILGRGLAFFHLREWPAAESDFRTAVALLQPLVQHSPALSTTPNPGAASRSTPPAEDLARAYNDLAAVFFNHDLPPLAAVQSAHIPANLQRTANQTLALYRDSVALITQLRRTDPHNTAYLEALIVTGQNEAMLFKEMHDLPDAVASSQQALDAVETLANPDASFSLKELKILDDRTQVLIQFDNGGPAALDAVDRERDLLDSLGGSAFISQNPQSPVTYATVADNYGSLFYIDLGAKARNLQGAFVALYELREIEHDLSASDRKNFQEAYQAMSQQLIAAVKAATPKPPSAK